MCIVIEGPDGAGKTTLVQKLKRQFPQLVDGERGTEDRTKLYTVTVPDTYYALKLAVDPQEAPRIWDRLFYSEFVYAPIAGREPMFSTFQTEFIQRTIEAMRVPVILCLPPLSDVKKNILVEKQMDGVIDKINSIYTSYTRMLRDRKFPLYSQIYDYSRSNVNEQYTLVCEYIDQYLYNRKMQQW